MAILLGILGTALWWTCLRAKREASCFRNGRASKTGVRSGQIGGHGDGGGW